MNSNCIAKMLKEKHHKDLFVEECKNGSTWLNMTHSRADAWVMARSWSNPKYIAYEIKVSKSDFRADNKYVNYLPMCNELYFVCPWGMIDVKDIPLEVGLMYVSKNGSRLITRKKAVYREICDPVDTLKYVLMSRTKVVRDNHLSSNAEYWKDWVKNNKDELDTGRIASKKIRELVDRKINDVKRENAELRIVAKNHKDLYDSVTDIIEAMHKLGINDWSIIQRSPTSTAETLKRKIGEDLDINFRDLLNKMNNTTKAIIDAISYNKQEE